MRRLLVCLVLASCQAWATGWTLVGTPAEGTEFSGAYDASLSSSTFNAVSGNCLFAWSAFGYFGQTARATRANGQVLTALTIYGTSDQGAGEWFYLCGISAYPNDAVTISWYHTYPAAWSAQWPRIAVFQYTPPTGTTVALHQDVGSGGSYLSGSITSPSFSPDAGDLILHGVSWWPGTLTFGAGVTEVLNSNTTNNAAAANLSATAGATTLGASWTGGYGYVFDAVATFTATASASYVAKRQELP